MRFKKVYIEITNGCNLDCDFCIGNTRKKSFLSFDEFKIILDKLIGYTSFLYFHVLGEPLLHPEVNKFIDYAFSKGFFVNITTNGYLIDRLVSKNVRQVNISLHSYNERYLVSIDDYLNKICDCISRYDNTYFSLRIWLNNDFSNYMFSFFLKRYNLDESIRDLDGLEIKRNVYFSKFHEFIWPDLKNDYYCDKGKCYGLIDHIGILCDGTIVPCCLDSRGDMRLGNIFLDGIEDVLKKERVLKMIQGFKQNKKCEELCKHCSFLD